MKKVRKKRCVICNESFTPQYTITQRCCSPKCAIDFAKVKEATKNSQLNDLRNEKVKIESLSILKDSTKNIVHSYIRQRDKGKPCISCGASWRVNFQAGHCFNVKQYNMIRYDLMNIHGQCKKCNLFDEGNYDKYLLNLPKRIGDEMYQKLIKRAKIALRVPYTFTRTELKEIQKATNIKKKELKLKLW